MSTIQKSEPVNRREALMYMAAMSVVLLVGIIGWLAYRFLLPPSVYTEIGQTTNYPPGPNPYEVWDGQFFYLVNTGDKILALSPRPPHSFFHHCLLKWDMEEHYFIEPCGGARFELDGSYQEGPSPAGMSLYPITIIDDVIWVDTTREFPGKPTDQ